MVLIYYQNRNRMVRDQRTSERHDFTQSDQNRMTMKTDAFYHDDENNRVLS